MAKPPRGGISKNFLAYLMNRAFTTIVAKCCMELDAARSGRVIAREGSRVGAYERHYLDAGYRVESAPPTFWRGLAGRAVPLFLDINYRQASGRADEWRQTVRAVLPYMLGSRAEPEVVLGTSQGGTMPIGTMPQTVVVKDHHQAPVYQEGDLDADIPLPVHGVVDVAEPGWIFGRDHCRLARNPQLERGSAVGSCCRSLGGP